MFVHVTKTVSPLVAQRQQVYHLLVGHAILPALPATASSGESSDLYLVAFRADRPYMDA